MPLRRHRRTTTPELPLYRRFVYGNTAQFDVLDTRQYRTDQPCDDTFGASCGEENDPDATILGDEQATWLERGMDRTHATWKVLPQQIFLASIDVEPGEPSGGYNHGWDGYRASRERLLGLVEDRDIDNFVVLTGDIHCSWLNDLRRDFEDPDGAVLGTELVGTSITSNGDGTDATSPSDIIAAENPHIRFYSGRRGYVRAQIDRDTFAVDYCCLPDVSTPGAPVSTLASFVIEAGSPVAQEA